VKKRKFKAINLAVTSVIAGRLPSDVVKSLVEQELAMQAQDKYVFIVLVACLLTMNTSFEQSSIVLLLLPFASLDLILS
jgi:hypothetical protein